MADAPALELRFAPGPSIARDLTIAALDDHEPIAIHEADADDWWLVFFRTPAARDAAAAALAADTPSGLLSIARVDVPDQDWARRSQVHLRAIQVGRVVVAPPWDVPVPGDAGPIVLVIEPSTGFGTGHHQSTRLCLRLLQRFALAGTSVIDVGTGSGVLALAAVRLGARAPVTAIDYDTDALRNAVENAERNGLTGEVRFVAADLRGLACEPAGLVVANLTGAVIRAEAAALRGLVAGGGRLIVSGFGPDELERVCAAIGTAPAAIEHEADWVGVLFELGS